MHVDHNVLECVSLTDKRPLVVIGLVCCMACTERQPEKTLWCGHNFSSSSHVCSAAHSVQLGPRVKNLCVNADMPTHGFFFLCFIS